MVPAKTTNTPHVNLGMNRACAVETVISVAVLNAVKMTSHVNIIF